mgnify:CR=1 FL=1
MNFLISFLFFVLGTLIGSFLNVVILRYNTGKHIFGWKERSICFSCSKKLAWHELVPVVSFCFLGGRCRGCKSRISWQYPLVEITTGLIFVGIFAQNFPIIFSLFAVAIWSSLIVITVYDLRHKIIPDGLVYAFIILSFLAAAIFPSGGGGFLHSLFAGAVFFTFFAGLWLISGGRWLGFGDAKLVLGVGFLLGLARGLSALTLAFWIGAVVSIFLLGLNWLAKKLANGAAMANSSAGGEAIQFGRLRSRLFTLTMKSEIPFAPFIILGALIAFFWNIDIFGLAGLLFTM